MKIIFRFATILLFVFPLTHCYALQNRDLRFLTTQDGLPDNTISSILKDSNGFMWFATSNGLSRYDGQNFKNFYFSFDEAQQTRQLYEADDNYLWLTSKQVLYAFDKRRERFLSVVCERTGKPISIRMILKGKGGLFWGIYQDKLFSFKRGEVRSDQLTVCLREEVSNPSKEENFSAICHTPDSLEIYLATNRLRLMKFSPTTSRLSALTRELNEKLTSVPALSADGEFVWMATGGQGVFRFHLPSGRQEQFIFHEDKRLSSLSHISAYNLLKISDHTYFVPTWNGYTLFRVDNENLSKVNSEIYDNNSFLDFPNIETRMISAYYDRQNETVWIGTRGGGVIRLDMRKKHFHQYNQKRHNEIIHIEEDTDHYIWLATYHEGLMRSKEPFLKTNATADFIPIATGYDPDTYIPNCGMKDEKGNLWFGHSPSILLRWSATDKTMQAYDLSAHKASNGKMLTGINSLCVDHQNRMWLATSQGLFLFNRESGQCTEMPLIIEKRQSYLNINAISVGRNGDLWLGTFTGLYRISLKGNQVAQVRNGYEKQKGVTPKPVNGLLMVNDEEAYIGYAGGFAALSQAEDRIIDFYTIKDGLPSNEVNCVVQDAKSRIWIGSSSGISRYSRHQKIFYNYYISSSNRSGAFIENTLLFGSNKSLTYFDPEKILKTSRNNKVRFLDLEVNHLTAPIGTPTNGQQLLAKAITYTDSLTLNYKNRDFSLSFSTLTFNDNKQQYAYRLLPYQKQWVLSHEGDKATYTNLPEGNYLFEVKAVYPDDVISEVSSIHIKLLPHWSQSFWFRSVLFFLAALLLCLLFYRFRKQQRRMKYEMQLRHELEIAHIEREKEKQIKEERELFFTNSAHELRTPLTLILGPLQEILDFSSLPETIRAKSALAMRNAQSLLSLANQLLYIQKIEAGMVKLTLSEVDLKELLYNEYLLFKPTAIGQKKTSEIHLPTESANVWIDREKIISAVRNLLSNAFKYTTEEGCIELSLSQTGRTDKDFYLITVKDNGSGIPPSLQERVFDSFITGQNTASFSNKVGIGLRIVKNTMDLHHGKITLKSAEGEGSTFTLYLPKGKDHYAQDAVEWIKTDTPQEEKQVMGLDSTNTATLSSKKLSLLIIEDNEEIRQYLCSLFCKEYRLWEAGDGEEGVRMARKEQPDLILSDVIMPLKDGFECCREIRSHPLTAHIPIILLTAKAEDADRVHGSLQGADDYMMKPFNPELLKVRVESLITQRSQLKRIYTKALMLKEQKEGDPQNDFIDKIISIVEANLSSPTFNVKSIAEGMNMSQPTLYRKLKQHTNLSIIEVVRNVRISKAASLILTQKYAIQEVAEMVGFNDLPTFRKYFVKQFGVSPSHYLGTQ